MISFSFWHHFHAESCYQAQSNSNNFTMIGLDAGYAALVAGGLSFGWLLFVWCSGRRDHGINSTDGNTALVWWTHQWTLTSGPHHLNYHQYHWHPSSMRLSWREPSSAPAEFGWSSGTLLPPPSEPAPVCTLVPQKSEPANAMDPLRLLPPHDPLLTKNNLH